MREKITLCFVVLFACIVMLFGDSVNANDNWHPEKNWAKGIKIRMFVGGDPGDKFASIIYRGAQQAQMDLGCDVEYVFSGWSIEKITSQFREAVAAKPDGIVMVGIAGDAGNMEVAKSAHDAGINMMWITADVKKVRAEQGGGYIGVLDLTKQGRDLAEEALNKLSIPEGKSIIVFGAFGQPGRYYREEGAAARFEEAGYKVIRITVQDNWASDPSVAIAPITGAVLSNPDAKLIVFPGGQLLGAVPVYMKAINKRPGDIYCIGFDTSSEVMKAFNDGYVQLTSDQQPFIHGYLSILSLCLQTKYQLAPLVTDTGAGFVGIDNYKAVEGLANLGLR